MAIFSLCITRVVTACSVPEDLQNVRGSSPRADEQMSTSTSSVTISPDLARHRIHRHIHRYGSFHFVYLETDQYSQKGKLLDPHVFERPLMGKFLYFYYYLAAKELSIIQKKQDQELILDSNSQNYDNT